MFLAAKVEEIVVPSAINFLYCADSSYTEAKILQAEKYILKMLEWNMARWVSKADEYNVQAQASPRDDLESLSYMLVYFLRDTLPWRKLKAPTIVGTWDLIHDAKLSTGSEPHAERV
ncbi:hypothetical protein BJV77DRAFT_1074117 [Russula vinacea]|nr:hypothetical protein BJV77DRAFT_1074117 [Russula vinacea]